MRAVRIHTTGGVDVLNYETVPDPVAKEGEVIVCNQAIGVNFIDTYHRSGLYSADLPATLGLEGAGEIVAVGKGVAPSAVGTRVVYFGKYGAYAEYSAVPAARVVGLPVGGLVDTACAAAVFVQGLTAHYLVHNVFPIQGGEQILVYAAAGGVGRLLCQWARRKGARVIGVVSTTEKEDIARKAGAEDIIRRDREPIVERVNKITNNRGVDAVFDSVGKATIDASLEALTVRGMLVSYGQSSGMVAGIAPSALAARSLFLSRPSLFHYIADREELKMRASALFSAVDNKIITPLIYTQVPLSDSGTAHTLLETGQSFGKILLTPS